MPRRLRTSSSTCQRSNLGLFVSVAIDLALDRLFTYSVPVELTEKLRVGQLLRVPFGGREARGFALSIQEDLNGLKGFNGDKGFNGLKGVNGGKGDKEADKEEQACLAGFEDLQETDGPKIKPILGIVDEAPFF